MKKAMSTAKMTLHRETLRLLESPDLETAVGGVTGPNSLCTTRLCETKPVSACC